MPKPFLTYEQQLNKLTQEKNLIIQSPSDAEEYLKRIGYYALICGYKDIFKNPTTKKYKDGVTFEEIVALYRFDEALRELFLKYLIRIERHLRSSISYYFTDLHGESQNEYLNYMSSEVVEYIATPILGQNIISNYSLASDDVNYDSVIYRYDPVSKEVSWLR